VLRVRTLVSAPLALAYWLGVAGAAKRNNGRGRILMLHGIPRQHAGLFRRVLKYIRRNFEVVPLEVLAAGAASGTDTGLRTRLAITFDDGLRNNVEVAYPILKALGAPATFFVCPELIDEGRWLWNHEARQRLRTLAPAARLELAHELGGDKDVESIIYRMKRLPPYDRSRAEQRIREATPGFAPSAAERHQFDLAGWDELRGLDPSVVTLGSHTLTHPILTTLSGEEAEREIAGSRRLLERRLERAVESFAYPNGDADDEVLACVRRNYRSAVSVEEGQVAPGCDPHMLPRINVPGSVLRLALSLHRDHFLVTPTSVSGSQVASSGNSVISAMHSTIMKKNGSEASAT
jgi:peptidoglycan/xylan/chitin deacetylase (PgdA/CDA1 family)